MADIDKTPAPIDDFAAWASEATAKAKTNAAAKLAHGDIVNGDPRLHYVVLDGDAPKPSLERHRAYHEALGFRLQEGVQVIGYRAPVVMAVPLKVYQTVIRAQRVADVGKSMAKWGGMSMQVMAPVQYS